MIPLRIPVMDMSNKTALLVFLMIYTYCVSGLNVPQPEKLVVDIMDGEIIVLWKHPEGAPLNFKYNVEMARYTEEWAMVTSCTGITHTYCDLSGLIPDYRTGYKVKVQLTAGNNESEWTMKKFLPNNSKLQPPSFSLWATSSTLTVHVHRKPILRKLFPFGLLYTIYLEKKGQDNDNTTAYLKDTEEDQSKKTFRSLRWGTMYCVSIKVEGNGALSTSSVSPKQCLQLPEQEWYIIAVASLSSLGVLAFLATIATILLCYVRRPEKTPAVLKHPVSGWLPLSVAEGSMEVVTDNGWFLSSYRTEVKDCVKVPVAHVTITKDNDEKDRKISMDSGVSMKSSSTEINSESPPVAQEDSGCGSLGGPESSSSNQTDYPLQEARTRPEIAQKRGDSGVGMSCQLHSSPINLDGQDSRSRKETVAGGTYRSQSPSGVQINVSDDKEVFGQMHRDSVLAEMVTGYRTGPQSCICSEAGQCSWCHKQGFYGTGAIKQYRALWIDNGIQSRNCGSVDKGITCSSFSKNTEMDIVTMEDVGNTFIPLGETFPLLTALTSVPLVNGGQDFNMNNVLLSLSDIQLTTD